MILVSKMLIFKIALISLAAVTSIVITFASMFIYKRYKTLWEIIWQLRNNQEEIQKNQEEIKTDIGLIIRKLNYLKLSEKIHRQELRLKKIVSSTSVTDKERSVVFLHNSYYHFYYLAKALRKRGWDAISVSYEDPINGANVNYYHGEDINLFSPNPEELHENIEDFFDQAKERFALMHFAGDGLLSFFPENYVKEHPEDIIEWRSLGKKVAYTVSGCNSGVAQSTVMQWSAMDDGKIVCDTCMWQNIPDVCNDKKNLDWGIKVDKYCDLIFGEAVPSLDYMDSHKAILEPLTMCLEPKVWCPELPVPEHFKIAKNEEEILIYHAVGNYELRTQGDGRNIKGTPAVFKAIERLKSEGIPVRLIFVTGMKNIDVRYIQVQADVIVDQLNYGRYGATSREGMMLGKPVICYINKYEKKPNYKLSCLDELPLISAGEETVYEVLKELVLDPDKRHKIGKQSREYALKWHSPDACAERYEEIYDRLIYNQGETSQPIEISGS